MLPSHKYPPEAAHRFFYQIEVGSDNPAPGTYNPPTLDNAISRSTRENPGHKKRGLANHDSFSNYCTKTH